MAVAATMEDGIRGMGRNAVDCLGMFSQRITWIASFLVSEYRLLEALFSIH